MRWLERSGIAASALVWLELAPALIGTFGGWRPRKVRKTSTRTMIPMNWDLSLRRGVVMDKMKILDFLNNAVLTVFCHLILFVFFGFHSQR